MALTDEQKDKIRMDFVAWSGGIPSEVDIKQKELYVDCIAPREFDKDDVDDFLEEWEEALLAEENS